VARAHPTVATLLTRRHFTGRPWLRGLHRTTSGADVSTATLLTRSSARLALSSGPTRSRTPSIKRYDVRVRRGRVRSRPRWIDSRERSSTNVRTHGAELPRRHERSHASLRGHIDRPDSLGHPRIHRVRRRDPRRDLPERARSLGRTLTTPEGVARGVVAGSPAQRCGRPRSDRELGAAAALRAVLGTWVVFERTPPRGVKGRGSSCVSRGRRTRAGCCRGRGRRSPSSRPDR
jgi:hypothetical protein